MDTELRHPIISRIGLLLGPLSFISIYLFADMPSDSIRDMTAVAVLMVIWWITEAIPLAATALIPLVLFPFLGITSGKEVAGAYMNSTIFLFIGGFALALSMQRWGLHTRIALRIISWFHGNAQIMVLGFMITAAFLSMWISNTATATMLLPIGLAVYMRSSEHMSETGKHCLLTSLMLGIAYACSIGGAGTLIGTPPNMAMQRIFEISFPAAPEISFAEWMFFAFPVSITMLGLTWLVITLRYTRHPECRLEDDTRHVQADTSPMSFEQRAVAIVFTLTALSWVFRKDISLGFLTVPGWSNLLDNPRLIDDGTVAIAATLALFLIPTRDRREFSNIADTEIIATLPWKIVLLFGGGFALAKGFTTSGLSEFIGQQFINWKDTDPVVLIAGISTVVVFLTEVTSNTATAEMLLPIVASVAESLEMNPLLLMLPVTLAASMAFMMPVATPPNAIVFASGKLRIYDMVKTGFIINLIAIAMITIAITTWGMTSFAIEHGVMPDWAQLGSDQKL